MVQRLACLCGLIGLWLGPAWALTPSGPITVNTSNAVIEGLHISGTGDCVTITGGATNITIRANEIGPCTARGIRIVNGTNHKIYDNYIHPQHRPNTCCDTGTSILIDSGVGAGLEIQGNVICFGEANITKYNTSNVTVHGNYSCNPQGNSTGDGGGTNGGGRGQHFHAVENANNSTITSNFLYSCTRAADGFGGTICPSSPNYPMSERQEDAINFYGADTALVQNNYIIGGHSTSGTAMIADGPAGNPNTGMQFRNNILHNTAHVGIGIFVGSNHVIDGNKIQNACIGGWTCTNDNAISVFDGHGIGCGPVQVSNNIADQTRPPGTTHASYWGGDGGCNTGVGGDSCCNGGGTTLSGNTFDLAAFNILDPILTTNPPPLIPPVPKNCTAVSPYTTQTSLPLCGATAVTDVPVVLRLVR